VYDISKAVSFLPGSIGVGVGIGVGVDIALE